MNDPSGATSDRELMRRVQAGETDCFADLIHRYRPALLRVAQSHLGRIDRAEDAVQDAFLAAYRARQTYDERFGFRTWLWTILLNQCRRHARRWSRWPRVGSWTDEDERGPLENAVESAANQAPVERLLAAERSDQLDRLLSQLRRTQAEALRLRFFGGLQFQEIADAMQCSLGTAKNRVKAGLLRMTEMLVAPSEQTSASDPCEKNNEKP